MRENDVFSSWDLFHACRVFFPPQECYLILNVRRFYLKIFSPPVALYVGGTDGTKARDNTGKTEGCWSEVTCPRRLNMGIFLTSTCQLLKTVIAHYNL